MIPVQVKQTAKWCVSHDKRPLDVYALKKGVEWGASFNRSHSAYGTFEEVKKISESTGYPMTLFVDSEEQHIMMIDIEKTCPQEIRQALLKALQPFTKHLEWSLSNKGFHLLVDIDQCVALKTQKYKQWFEILSNHHCTFTMNEVNFDDAYNADVDTNEFITDDDKDIELLDALKNLNTSLDLYHHIASSKPTVMLSESEDLNAFKKAAATFDGRHADLFNQLCNVNYKKTLDDHFGDYSRYEFGYASTLHYHLQRFKDQMIDEYGHTYELSMTQEQCIMIVYMVLKQMLPPRDKHNEFRNGLPWLLYTSQNVYLKTFVNK